MGPLHFQARCCRRRLNLAFVFIVYFVLLYISFDWWLCAFVVLGLVFPHQAKRFDWETSPKWPILCQVWCKILTQSTRYKTNITLNEKQVNWQWHTGCWLQYVADEMCSACPTNTVVQHMWLHITPLCVRTCFSWMFLLTNEQMLIMISVFFRMLIWCLFASWCYSCVVLRSYVAILLVCCVFWLCLYSEHLAITPTGLKNDQR